LGLASIPQQEKEGATHGMVEAVALGNLAAEIATSADDEHGLVTKL